MCSRKTLPATFSSPSYPMMTIPTTNRYFRPLNRLGRIPSQPQPQSLLFLLYVSSLSLAYFLFAFMGCGVSKLEPGEEASARMRPIQNRIDEIKRRRKSAPTRRDSIVSTTELLHAPEEVEEAAYVEISPESSVQDGNSTLEKGRLLSPVKETESVVLKHAEEAPAPAPAGLDVEVDRKDVWEEDENKKEEVEIVEDEKEEIKEEQRDPRRVGGLLGERCRKLRLSGEDEELPGSPSFRFLVRGSISGCSDDEWVKEHSKIEEDRSPARKDSIGSSNSEELEGIKSPTKTKGSRFKSLAKGSSTSSSVYGFLNVRSCYNKNSSSHQKPNPCAKHKSSSHNNLHPCAEKAS